jgi:hypothetical protein
MAPDRNRSKSKPKRPLIHINFVMVSCLRKQESSRFWIPGRASLARNDNSIPKKVKRCESSGGFSLMLITKIRAECVIYSI